MKNAMTKIKPDLISNFDALSSTPKGLKASSPGLAVGGLPWEDVQNNTSSTLRSADLYPPRIQSASSRAGPIVFEDENKSALRTMRISGFNHFRVACVYLTRSQGRLEDSPTLGWRLEPLRCTRLTRSHCLPVFAFPSSVRSDIYVAPRQQDSQAPSGATYSDDVAPDGALCPTGSACYNHAAPAALRFARKKSRFANSRFLVAKDPHSLAPLVNQFCGYKSGRRSHAPARRAGASAATPTTAPRVATELSRLRHKAAAGVLGHFAKVLRDFQRLEIPAPDISNDWKQWKTKTRESLV